MSCVWLQINMHMASVCSAQRTKNTHFRVHVVYEHVYCVYFLLHVIVQPVVGIGQYISENIIYYSCRILPRRFARCPNTKKNMSLYTLHI